MLFIRPSNAYKGNGSGETMEKFNITFLVLGEGGTPLCILPERTDEKTTVLTSLISASGGLSETLAGKNDVFYLESGNVYLLRKKIKKLSFVLIAPKNVEKTKAEEILTTLSEEFGNRYGFNLNEIQKKLMRGEIDFTEFHSFATEYLIEKVGTTTYYQFKEFIEELHSKLRAEGVSVENVSKHFTQVQVPILTDKKIIKKEEPNARKLLKLCTGDHSIEDITNKLGLPRIQVMKTLSKFKKKGKIRFETEFRLQISN